MRVGFIGLGVMGLPMARNIAQKHTLLGYDIDPKRAGALPEGTRAADLKQLTEDSEVVLLSLPSSGIVKRVCLGDGGATGGGLVDLLAEGKIVVDTSTTEPTVSQEIAAALADRGIGFLDAPVSGGEKGAVDATLSVMVGGPREQFDRCLPVLECLGSTVVRMGEAGMGEVCKLVNNLIVGITFAAVAEGFALGTRSGLDPAALFEAIRGGWAGSKVLEVSAPAMLERNFEPGGTVDIHWKDMGYALSLAKDTDVPVPVTSLVHEIFKAARASGRGGEAQPAIVKLWEELLDLEVRRAEQ
jgi:2-hydroxy-3-oxopropionate reductase